MSRDTISKEASLIESAAKSKGTSCYNGTKESEEAEQVWFSLSGEASQLSNDCCETQHKLVTLRKRLKELKTRFGHLSEKGEK